MHPTDQIETYLTGGLSPGERAEFEAHVLDCPACAALVDEARAADAALNDLFAGVRPPADFEDRMIQAIALPQPWVIRPIIHPMVRRVAIGVAASLMIGGIGYFANIATIGGRPALGFSLPNETRERRTTSNLRNIAAADTLYSQTAHVLSADANRQFEHNTQIDMLVGGVEETTGKSIAASGARYMSTVNTSDAPLADLKRQATDLTKKGQYNDARGVVDQILKLDPNDGYALGVRPMLEDRSEFQAQRSQNGKDSAQGRTPTASDKTIPYDDVLHYPTNWPDATNLGYKFDLRNSNNGALAWKESGPAISINTADVNAAGGIGGNSTFSKMGSDTLALAKSSATHGDTNTFSGVITTNGGTLYDAKHTDDNAPTPTPAPTPPPAPPPPGSCQRVNTHTDGVWQESHYAKERGCVVRRIR
jgi:hypothetical protein